MDKVRLDCRCAVGDDTAAPRPWRDEGVGQIANTMTVGQDSDVSLRLRSLECSSSLGQKHPKLIHTLKHESSVLTLAVSAIHGRVFAGLHDGGIMVWSLATCHQVRRTQAHKRSVLSLLLSTDESLLISTAADPIISIWCPKTLSRLYEVYSTYDVGDIFCTAFDSGLNMLFVGAQNATIQWICLDDNAAKVTMPSQSHPDHRNHRFFDSKAIGGSSTPRRNEGKWDEIPQAAAVMEMDSACIRNFAHNGYVYCMVMAKGPTFTLGTDDEVLISGGGDGTIKLWRPILSSHQEDHSGPTTLIELTTLGSDDAESVLSLALDGSFLYSGKLDGIVELWDLDTSQKLRVIKAHDSDLMSLQMGWGHLYTVTSCGEAAKYSTAHYGRYQRTTPENVTPKYQCVARWQAHHGKILTSHASTFRGQSYFITGANDGNVKLWSFSDQATTPLETHQGSEDVLISTLAEFISYKTVSSRPEYAEDCRKGTNFLGSLFKRMGAEVHLLCSDSHHNPIVCAKFTGKQGSSKARKRVLFYGHYDVVAADNKKGLWTSGDPFEMIGANGFLYGRGVSDNKGPVIAALFAVTDLVQKQLLENDIVFIIEGEEESGSRGFEDAIVQNKAVIGPIDYVLLANSYWLDDEVPCLTYGLRGVLHATVCVDSPQPDTHSGVDGSHMINEPLSDLTAVLSTLKGRKNKVQLPGFYDGIAPMTAKEDELYDDIVSILSQRNEKTPPEPGLKRSLMARWREPNLTIHRYKVSGPEGSLVSAHASAHISLRLVPGQKVHDISLSLSQYLEAAFARLESSNQLIINIDNSAESWLGDPTNAIFRTLEQALLEAWPACFETANAIPRSQLEQHDASHYKPCKPRKPLYIREGGSIPAIRFLEKEFEAPAAHLPCGRSSDAAHLDNERMSVLNLLKAREVFAKVFARL